MNTKPIAMDEKQKLLFRKLYFAVWDFMGNYEAFLETRDINTNKRCNDAYMWMQDAMQAISFS